MSLGAKIVGHRGAMGICPENTLPGFEFALEFNAYGIELDVHYHNDRLYVIHDDTVDSTTNGSGSLYDMSHEELMSLHVGGKAYLKIPTLEEVVDLVRRIKHNTVINIELKGVGSGRPTGRFLREYMQNREAFCDIRSFLITSFLLDELEMFEDETSGFRIGRLLHTQEFTEITDPSPRGLMLDVIGVNKRSLTQSFIDHVHEEGLEVKTWVVDDPAEAIRLSDMGVDYIGTNRPDRMVKHFSKYQ